MFFFFQKIFCTKNVFLPLFCMLVCYAQKNRKAQKKMTYYFEHGLPYVFIRNYKQAQLCFCYCTFPNLLYTHYDLFLLYTSRRTHTHTHSHDTEWPTYVLLHIHTWNDHNVLQSQDDLTE